MRAEPIIGHTGLRGIAALCVFIHHLHLDRWFPNTPFQFVAFLASWPGYAVDLFFILSGFILGHVYSSNINWKQYFIARFARIFPLSLAVVVFCVGLDLYSKIAHDIPSANLEFSRILYNILNIQSWYGNAVENSINPPSWSISVEVFLYIFVLPVLYYFLRFKTPRKISIFLFGLLVLLLIFPTLSFYHSFPFQSLIRGVILFTAGFGIKKVTQIFASPSWSSIAALIAVLIIVVAIFKGLEKSYIIYPALFSLVYFTSFNNSASAALGFPFLAWLGERSYSIYILHHPLIVVFFRLVLYPNMGEGDYPLWVVSLTLLLIFISTFVCAEISYRFF